MPRDLRLLTDEQWNIIEPLLPAPRRSPKGGRVPRANRLCFEGILWVLRSGARWKDLPERYPSPATCWRRLRDWEESGVWLKVWRALLAELDARQVLDWEECFTDASFSPAKKGAPQSERPNAERVQSGWWWRTARVFLWECPSRLPVRPRLHSSSRRSRR